MTNTKRNTKKAPENALQSDKTQGNTTVAPKTTRATKSVQKPTIASLQTEVENLTQQLIDANQLVVSLDKRLIDNFEELRLSTERFKILYKTPLTVIVYQRFTDWLYNVTKNFRE